MVAGYTLEAVTMTVTFNHTIVYATDKRHSAEFLAKVLGLPEPQAMWSFMTVPLDHVRIGCCVKSWVR